MSQNNLPLPSESLRQIARDIFLPLKNRDCFTCLCPAGIGRRTLLNFFLKDGSYIEDIFKNEYNTTLFVNVNLDDAIDLTNESCIKVLLETLIHVMKSKGLNAYVVEGEDVLSSIKKNIEILVSKGFYIIFLLNDFEFLFDFSPTIFRNLESIIAINKSQVNFAFFSSTNLLTTDILSRLHNFKYAVTQNLHYQGLLEEKGTLHIISNLENKLKYKLSLNSKNLLMKVCGGHAQLIKYTFYALKDFDANSTKDTDKVKEYLFNNYQLKNICDDIWTEFNEAEKQIVTDVFLSGQITASRLSQADYLIKTGIIKLKENHKYQLFGEFFSRYVESKLPQDKLTYDEKTGQIFLGTKNFTNKFTLQESKVLTHFIINENKIITRDQVAEVIWGKNYVEKYSDWSIDKAISTIRKKLNQIGYPSKNLVTLKRRGFSFTN